MFADSIEAPRNQNQKHYLTFTFASFQDQEVTRGFIPLEFWAFMA